MATRKQAAKIIVNGIDLTTVFRRASIPVDRDLRAHFKQMRKSLAELERQQRIFEGVVEKLQSVEKLDNFEIQDLMSQYNQAEVLASEVSKKLEGAISCAIRKIG